jgi:hypothetical protein
VSRFRAARQVQGPDGQVWDIYVYRVQFPSAPSVPLGSEPGVTVYGPEQSALWALAELPIFLLKLAAALLLWLVRAPFAVAGGLSSRVYYVEAVDFTTYPHEAFLWTTTKDHVDRVVDQVARGMKAGDVPRPLGATYRGSARD